MVPYYHHQVWFKSNQHLLENKNSEILAKTKAVSNIYHSKHVAAMCNIFTFQSPLPSRGDKVNYTISKKKKKNQNKLQRDEPVVHTRQ